MPTRPVGAVRGELFGLTQRSHALAPFLAVLVTEAGMRCGVCGQDEPGITFSGGRCDACHWDRWIPASYQVQEKYLYDPLWKHANATEHPPLGVAFLDNGPRLLSDGRIPGRAGRIQRRR